MIHVSPHLGCRCTFPLVTDLQKTEPPPKGLIQIPAPGLLNTTSRRFLHYFLGVAAALSYLLARMGACHVWFNGSNFGERLLQGDRVLRICSEVRGAQANPKLLDYAHLMVNAI